MAKNKFKPVEETVINVVTSQDSVQQEAEPVIETAKDNNSQRAVDGIKETKGGMVIVADEARAKLESYAAMETANAEYAAKNADLEARLVEYISEIESLRHEIEKLKAAQLKQTNKPDPRIDELEKTVSRLQDENDKYLMRISELTFENAKLTSQISNMTHTTENTSRHNQQQQQPIYPNVYRNNGLNGYSDWN